MSLTNDIQWKKVKNRGERQGAFLYKNLLSIPDSPPNKTCATLMILVQKYCLRWIQR